MTIALIYARVSTEEQGRGYSLPTQIAAAEKRALDRGYEVAGVFTDEHTGTEFDRPGLSALYEALTVTGADIVLAHDIDRIGREVVVQAVIEREIEHAGARLEYVQGDYQDTPEGDLLKAVKGGIAAYENRQRVERTRRGKDGRARAGSVLIPASRAPYGYSYVPSPHRGDLVICDEQAAVVHQIYDWLTIDRLSSYEIARRLYESNIPSKGDFSAPIAKKSGRAEWAPTSVRRLVANPVYRGTWYWGKTRTAKRNGRKVKVEQPRDQWIAVTVPAIVDEDTWNRAQACLLQNKVQSRRNAKRHYLLQGRIFCTCGRRWVGRYKNHFDRAYYRCPTSENEPWRKACPTRFGFRQEDIEGAVWRYVIGQLLNPENLEAELERQRQMHQDERVQVGGRVRDLNARLKEVDRRIDILIGDVLDGLPQDKISRLKRELLAQRADIEDRRRQALGEIESVQVNSVASEDLLDLARMVQEAEPQLTDDERRRMLEILQLRVEVLDKQRARVSGIISDAVVNISFLWAR
jgi:site-specific DNA recombinase